VAQALLAELLALTALSTHVLDQKCQGPF
jgi:hypothetical protein